MTRDVRSMDATPPERRVGQDRPRAGSATPALLILRRGQRLQDPLTKGQRRPRGPRDTTGGGVDGRRLPHRNDGCLYAPHHYASERDRTPLA